MEETKVTSTALRGMALGETRTFTLPDASAIYSGKAIAYRLQNVLRCKFTTYADFETMKLTIKKLPKT